MSKKFKLVFCLAVGMLMMGGASAQVVQKFNLETHYGFIIPHAEELVPISNTNPIGFQFSYSRMGLSKEAWEVCNCFFEWGFQFNYHDFNNPSVLGRAYTTSTFFEPILFRQDKWNLSIRSGIGLSYLTQVYHEETNPENTFFSAPLSFLLFVQPKLNYRLTENLDGNLSVVYNHISNGGQSQPNRGMNYPMVGLGVTYFPNRMDFPSFSPKSLTRGMRYYAEVFGTRRQNPVRDDREFALGVGVGAYHTLTEINALGLGGEFIQDQSLNLAFEDESGFIAAPFVSHHLLFGRFEFAQRFAYYAAKPEGYNDHTFYQRYILQYRVWQGLHLGASLKTHGHVAENVDIRMQWKF